MGSPRTLKALGGIAACLVLGLFGFVLGEPVPLLRYANLGFHELGHLVTYPLPDMATAMAGSMVQVLVPLGLAAYFWIRQGDPVGAGVCLAWAGTSAQEAGIYIADAPVQALPLIGGEHDWAYILGPDGFDALGSAGAIASAVTWFGGSLLLAGLALCVWELVGRRRSAPRIVLEEGLSPPPSSRLPSPWSP